MAQSKWDEYQDARRLPGNENSSWKCTFAVPHGDTASLVTHVWNQCETDGWVDGAWEGVNSTLDVPSGRYLIEYVKL